MITGSELVFSNVPACQADPFLIVEGRSSGDEGYLVISYPEECHDLLFLRGREIRIGAHLRREYRFPLQPEAVRERYGQYRSDKRTVLSFYLSPSDSIRRFLSTFYYTSSLNIELAVLGRKQRQTLSAKAQGEQWLVELDKFSPAGPLPTSPSQRVTIEIQEVRKREELALLLSRMTSGHLILYDLERNLEMLRMKTQCAALRPSAKSSPSPSVGEAGSPAAGSPQNEIRDVRRESSALPPVPRIELAGPVRHLARGCQRHFDILFRRFRKEASQLLGMKYHALEAKAEKEVRLSEPGFRLERLSEESAPLVLRVMETIAKRAPLLKRSEIRCMTITLVVEFYSNHYEVLERNNILSAVEDFYRKLKS